MRYTSRKAGKRKASAVKPAIQSLNTIGSAVENSLNAANAGGEVHLKAELCDYSDESGHLIPAQTEQ